MKINKVVFLFVICISLVLFASCNKKYSISLNTNGGYLAETVIYHNGDKEIALSKPSMLHSDFIGWYKNSDFSGEPLYSLEAGIKEYITLYAKYKVQPMNSYGFDGKGIDLKDSDYKVAYTSSEDCFAVVNYLYDYECGINPEIIVSVLSDLMSFVKK